MQWRKVHEYLSSAGSCRTTEDFIRVACEELQSVIPFEAAGLHRTRDAVCLGGLGRQKYLIETYNTYYRTKSGDLVLSNFVVEWKKYSDLEYASDFMLPNGLFKTLACIDPCNKVTLSAHRSRLDLAFSDADVATIGVLNKHLSNYWALLLRAEGERRIPVPSREEIRERFRVLTPREAELLSLLARRLSTDEIASSLFISRRTVEKHVESIFQKLYVRSREQLRLRLEDRQW